MANRSKAKGTLFETQCVNYLKRWFPRVYRPALQGGMDTGDINGIDAPLMLAGVDGPSWKRQPFIFQCKNQKSWDVSGWLNATKEQAANKDPDGVGALLIKRRGVGDSSMGKTYAVMELSDLVSLLQEAGYE